VEKKSGASYRRQSRLLLLRADTENVFGETAADGSEARMCRERQTTSIFHCLPEAASTDRQAYAEHGDDIPHVLCEC